MSEHRNLHPIGWRIHEGRSHEGGVRLTLRRFFVDGMGRYVMDGDDILFPTADNAEQLRAQILEVEEALKKPRIKWQAGYGWVEVDAP